MSYGCGDDSSTTSYACFCYESSPKYSYMIDTRVQSACTADRAQNASAVQVFSSYCQLGEVAAITTGTASGSGSTSNSNPTGSPTASPASTPSAVAASSTTTTTSTPEPSKTPEKLSHTVAIAVGVSVPVAVIALGIAAFLLFRRRRTSQTPTELSAEDRHVNEAETREQKHEMALPAVEIADGVRAAELGTATKEGFVKAPVHELDGGERREKA